MKRYAGFGKNLKNSAGRLFAFHTYSEIVKVGNILIIIQKLFDSAARLVRFLRLMIYTQHD